MSHDALRNELFEVLKASTTASDIQKTLGRLKELSQAGKISVSEVNNVLTLLNSYGNELENKGQFKKAAHQFYTGGRVVNEFFPESAESRNQWFNKSGEMIRKSGEDHASFDDIDGAAACITISSLLQFMTTGGEWKVTEEMEAFVKKYRDKLPDGKWASRCVYIPYDIVGAITSIDPSLMERAETYTSTYLLINTKVSELFVDGIQETLQLARKKLTEKIKLPKINVDLQIPQDTVFNEEFQVKIKLLNTGEGIANNIHFELMVPEKLMIIDGNLVKTLQSLQTQENQALEYKFKYPEELGINERTIELNGELQYKNVLNDIRTLPLGPYDLTIRSFRKSDEIKNKLTAIEENYNKEISNLPTIVDQKLNSVIEIQKKTVDSYISQIKQHISNEEFSLAEDKIVLLNKLVVETVIPSINEIVNTEEQIKTSSKAISEIKDKLDSINVDLKEIDDNLTKIGEILG